MNFESRSSVGVASFGLSIALGLVGCSKSDDGVVPASGGKSDDESDGGSRQSSDDASDDDSDTGAGGGEGSHEPDGGNADGMSACAPGDEGCDCYGNGTCNGVLRCEGGTCREVEAEADCPAGSQGCDCYGNDTCDGDLRCSGGRCRAGNGAPSDGNGGSAGETGGGGSTADEGASGGGFGGTNGAGGSASNSGNGGVASGGNGGGAGASGGEGGAPYVPGPDDPCATVLLVLDRSTSMFSSSIANGSSGPYGIFPDRWEALRAAVAGLEPHAGNVAFGAMTYTGFNASNGSGECPVVESDTIFALDWFDGVLELIPPSEEAIPDAKGETPTADALWVAYELLDAVPTDSPKHVVLLTDGLPELCGSFDRGTWCGQDPAIGAVQDGRALGITTHVVGIGLGPSDVTAEEADAAGYFLNALAHAGQNRSVVPFPEASSPFAIACLQEEYQLLTGSPTGADLYDGGWRNYAQATYGADGAIFSDQLHLSPDAENLGSELERVIATIASCR